METCGQQNSTCQMCLDRAVSGRAGMRLAIVLAGLALLALPLDLPIAKYFSTHRLPGDLNRLVMLSEAFGYGLTALIILSMSWVLDPAKRKAWRWGFWAMLAAGVLANVVKLCVNRVRPHSVENFFDQDVTSLSSVSDTFLQFFPPLGFDSGMQSFPSAHAATAASLAVVLSWFYPRGRKVFVTLAVMACGQRLASQAHYLSDVLAGSAIGTFAATWVVQIAKARLSDVQPKVTAGSVGIGLADSAPLNKAS